MVKKIMTLTVIHQHPKVLLGMKKIGFGKGLWNGFGGRVEDGESIEECALREIKEESGVDVVDLEKMGVLNFFHGDDLEHEVHIFKATDIVGEPAESDEVAPKWFFVDEIPFNEMWKDDLYWMPLLLKGRSFSGKAYFDNDGNLLSSDIKEA